MRNPDEIYDEWLVLRCQGGDADALAILVRRWQPRLFGLAMRILHDRDAADDAVQSAWVDVVKRIQSVKDPRSIRSWLFRVVANKSTDTVRRRSTRRKKETAAETDQIPDPSSVADAENDRAEQQVVQLRRAMQTLDNDRREVLRLHYLEGLTIEAIAERLAIPCGTVKSRLYHAREKLKSSLIGEDNE